MADIRINALAGTATSSASDDYLAIDGAANGTRKLSAYSPTFGGTVTDSVAGPSLGTGINTQNFLASAGSGFVGYSLRRTDDTNGGWLIGTSAAVVGDFAIYQNQGSGSVPVQRLLIGTTGNATLAGNLTVSGTSATLNNGLIAASGSGFDVKNASSSAALTSIYGGSAYNNGAGITLAGTTHATQADTIVFTTGAYVERARLASSGNLLLGTPTDNTIGKLQVSGQATFTGNDPTNAMVRIINSNAKSIGLISGITSVAQAGFSIRNMTDAVDWMSFDSSGNATFAGRIGLTASGTNPIYSNFIPAATSTYAGLITMQAGGGSSAYGGALQLYGHSHASKPGWFSANISQGSGGKFAVNNSGLGGGTDVFTVDTSGNGSFSAALSIGNTVTAAVSVASTHKVTMVIGGVTYYLLASNV